MLGIRLSTICSRNQYETDTAPVIAELLKVAGHRSGVLAMEAGKWAGYYDAEHTASLVGPGAPLRAHPRVDGVRARVRPADAAGNTLTRSIAFLA